MTITTVGYDLSPKTFLGGPLVLYSCIQCIACMFSFSKNYSLICIHAGKIIGGFCALSGVFILTLPIPIVVNTDFQYTNSGKLQYQHLTLVNSDWILYMGPKTQISTLGIYDSTTKVEWTKV